MPCTLPLRSGGTSGRYVHSNGVMPNTLNLVWVLQGSIIFFISGSLLVVVRVVISPPVKIAAVRSCVDLPHISLFHLIGTEQFEF